MDTQIIDGKAAALALREELRQKVEADGLSPCLATVLVGDDPASAVYVRSKSRAAEKIGIAIRDHHLSAGTTQQQLSDLMASLNDDSQVNGILLQLPLPDHLDEEQLLGSIHPDKDVDGFHPVSLGRLVRGQPGLRSCTPAGCIHLINSTGVAMSGADAVVVGRSNIVGKPVALMLLENNATVTVCHSRTRDLQDVVSRADILVAAVGRPEFIPGDWIKPGAVVIDVGINRLDDGRLVGDVATEQAMGRAAHITPVPGGVGPMTIAMLMSNTIDAYLMQTGQSG